MNFIFKRITYLILIVILVLTNQSCNKNDINSQANTRGGIALTFDDYSISNWHSYLNLFDSLGIKATFYVSNYKKLNAAEKIKLHQLQDHGHEIAFHSTNHVNFLKCADSIGIERLFKTEVLNGLRMLNKDGFYPTTFAYPYGQHNDLIDKRLLKQFKSVRALNGTHDMSKSLVSLQNNKLLYGLGIDESSKRNLDKIEGLLFLAEQRDLCAVFLIHNIERNDINMQIPLWKLKQIISKAKSLNMRFYTISEISK